MKPAWTRPADLQAQLQQLWDQGRLLAWRVDGMSPFPLKLALKTPDSRDCSERFAEVREWARALLAGARAGYRLELREWRHPVIGRNELPGTAWVDAWDDALRWLGQQARAARFDELVAVTRLQQPALLAWLQRKPLQALDLADAWPRLLAVVGWLRAHPRPGIYLRQLDLPGVDTKFLEQHRAVLGELLDLALPEDARDPAATGVAAFARRYGFRDKPPRIRFRMLDPAAALLKTGAPEDMTLDAEAFHCLRPAVDHVFITENEVNYLAFPPAARSLVVFGAGYGLDALTATPWLQGRAVHYWGDIDTHGFAILDELRAGLPHALSFLMDRATLLAHEAHWIEEPSPTLRELARLSPSERALHDDLRWQRLAPRCVRLEQERIAFGQVEAALRRRES